MDRLHTGELTKEDAANRLNFLSAEYENEKFCEISIENNAIEDVVKQIMDIWSGGVDMKKVINGRSYNTETAKELGYQTNGYANNDIYFTGETLYR